MITLSDLLIGSVIAFNGIVLHTRYPYVIIDLATVGLGCVNLFETKVEILLNLVDV